ncbi:L-alanine-DL-glutamate epimerase-like enolase superfamily enzyme [Haloactinopolyspora alba]|uniref:L-alanine-DL-glutamate epimerase-like enolase superfamily enzyme n=1 Tax=Haloactinopolyspora alba TaxID=648780 RepID=A0A2P8E9F1_9ACTN|nr:L-alanine-DL-glutamate epimerase-like enolase superfamily enzyme [Haloactinopolyspora alba]
MQLPASPVETVRCRIFRMPADDGVAMSFAPMAHRVMAVVVVELADGQRGVGESWVNYPSWAWRERVATVHDGVAPLLRGRTFDDPAGAHDLMTEQLVPLGRQWGAPGPVRQAISAVDTALWDIAARHAGVPLADLLGGATVDELPVYGSSLGPAGVERTALHCQGLGLSAVKIKLGFGRKRDAANLRTARDVLGQDVHLFGDANQAWTLDEALEMVPVLHAAGVEWLEEPLRGDRVDELAVLRRKGGIALATGENLYGAAAFEPYVDSGAIDIVQPDVSKVGGPTEYVRVHELATTAGTTVNPHLYNGAVATAATLQVAAALPARLVEWDVRSNPLRAGVEHLLTGHGTVRVPNGPGLGVDIDLESPELVEEI